MSMTRILLVAAACLPLAACHQTTNNARTIERSVVSLDAVETRPLGASEWNAWRSAMTPSEKAAFDRHTSSEDKLRFVRSSGIDVRVMLNARLKAGMTLEEADQALKGEFDSIEFGDPADGWYHLSVYNGTSTTLIDLLFEPETWTLKRWQSYVRVPGSTSNALEISLQARLDRVLAKGMGQGEITNSYRTAMELRSSYERKMTDRRTDPNYAGFKSASSGDYATEAAFDRVNGTTQFWAVLNRKPDYIRNEGAWEYWYHKVPLVGQKDKYVVIEYRFENKRLESWWVYTTDFLGYSGFN